MGHEERGRPPLITCLCPTYGRFRRLQDSLTCFLYQTYPYKKLIILNDAPVPVTCNWPGVEVVNTHVRYGSLGLKRQALLGLVDKNDSSRDHVVAHWDDDDLYLPWHLAECLSFMKEVSVNFVKPHRSWVLHGLTAEDFRLTPPSCNYFEATYLFHRAAAMEYGGYTDKASGQGVRMLERAVKAKDLKTFTPPQGPSFVMRWGDHSFHISGSSGDHVGFALRNQDFGLRGDNSGKIVGEAEPLLPVNISDFADVLIAQAPPILEGLENGGKEMARKFVEGLQCWYQKPMV